MRALLLSIIYMHFTHTNDISKHNHERQLSSPLNLAWFGDFQRRCTMFQDIMHERCVEWTHVKHGYVCNVTFHIIPGVFIVEYYIAKKTLALTCKMSYL